MKTLITTLAIIVLLAPAYALAQHGHFMGMADELELTDQQLEQMQMEKLAHQKEMIQVKADLEKAKLELKEIMIAKQIDKNAALKKRETISAIKAKIAKKRLAAKIDHLKSLTDEQRAKMRKKMMRRGHRGAGRGHDRMGKDCDMSFCLGKGKGKGIGRKHFGGFGDEKNVEVIIEREIIEDDED
ncbi:MAG: periplasmic heavy metal sensor [candidate division Zixibacteria bacterium]|nr:periplasmic heavy metal sensor [candidate division Zixibacteria bacterium]